MEKIISVKSGEIIQKDDKEWVELADQEGKKHRVFPSMMGNDGIWVHLDKEIDMLKGKIESGIEGLALKLTKEKKGMYWNVIGVEQVKDVFKQKAIAEVQAISIDERQTSIEGQVALKEIGELIREDNAHPENHIMGNHTKLVELYFIKLYDLMSKFVYGAKNAKTTEEIPDKEAVSEPSRVDDSGGGVKTAKELMGWAISHGKEYTPTWVKKEALLGDGEITEEVAQTAYQHIKAKMGW